MKLRKSLNINIKKAYTEGIYIDNPLNRKLGRVGMKYGINIEGFEKEEDTSSEAAYFPKLILKRMQSKLSDRGFKFLKNIMQDEGFKTMDVYEYKGKVLINNLVEVNPERDKDIVNLGNRTEDIKKKYKENKHYAFVKKTYNKEALEQILFFNSEEEGKTKIFSVLNVLAHENEQYNFMLEEAKRAIYYDGLNEGKYSEDEDFDYYEKISNEEAERRIKRKGSKRMKERFQKYSASKKLIQILKKYNVDLDGESFGTIKNDSELVKKFRDFIINSSRQDFYDAYKDLITNKYFYSDFLLRGRIMLKYNKNLVGDGWDSFKKKDGSIDISKRDDLISLCNQIEYAIDDVLKDDKDIFINNPNIEFLDYTSNTNWGGASYSSHDKAITITDEYFKAIKESRKFNKGASTLSREKFLVEGFIHEIGHSTDLTSDIYDSEAYKDFAKYLGYDENRKYTIYTNAIKGEDADKFYYQDNNLIIEKDKKEELENKFKNLFLKSQKDEIIQDVWDNRQLGEVFISDYSNKSACEGYAEYFSFYIGNKAKIDKDIQEYKKNPESFLKNKDIKDWYKYSVYNQKWKDWIDRGNNKEVRTKYYQEVIKHNIEMLEDVQKIVNQLKNKYKKKD